MEEKVAQLPSEFRRRDARHPHLRQGERLLLDFESTPRAGQVVLIRRGGVFRLDIAPAEGEHVAVVRLAV
jgi:hypothetical protein